ncbi:MAG: phosphoribosylanthranilate isomerase [Alphaproteobacteria bacterium]
MSVGIKICGINSGEAAHAALAAGADFGGLVFRPRSPRRVSFDLARTLAGGMRGRMQVVAVFANAGDADIAGALANARPNLVQLHGSETPARVAHLRQRFGLPVIKAIAVAESVDIEAAHGFEDVADFLLFDARAPLGADYEGGHGAAFDWRLLSGKSFKLPWLLSGGLTPSNVAEAISVSGARFVDVSSGVEDMPGQKNPEKISAFVKSARAAALAGAP